jgi:hypothetical protein
MRNQPWTPDEEAIIRQHGPTMTVGDLKRAHFPDRSMASVQNKVTIMQCGTVNAIKHNPRALDAAIDIDSKIPEWLDALRPVALPAPQRTKATVSASNLTMVAGDFHFPQQCDESIAVFLETVRQLKPARVILNGDTVDLLAVSKYPKDQRHNWQLREEVTAFHEFLHRLMAIGNAWGLRVIETEANHSGNGTASRWHRYLSDRVPVLYGHPKAQELLSYETWFYPEWCPISLVESVVIADDLLVLHGDIVRKHAAYSARGHAEKWHSSVMHSHTHRMGSSMERIPSVGNRVEGVRRAYEIGCMCNVNPTYASAPNWTNGFAIIAEDAADYGVELVSINAGQAVVTTLGQTVKAA